MTSALSHADPVAALITWLRAHASVLAEFGAADRVSGLNEAPYPHLQVAPSAGGSDRTLRWLIEPEVTLATYGTLDGTPGQAELRRLHYVAVAAAEELTRATVISTAAVVSAVRPSSAARWSPEPGTGQPAWRSTLLVSIHPPVEIP